MAQHHWMALFALEDSKPDEAMHHINHILELVSGANLVQMEETVALINQGQLHNVIHMVEGMIAGTALPDLTMTEMHLRLAASSATIEDAEAATHHLEHYLALAQPGSQEFLAVTEVINLIESGQLGDAEHEISELAGLESEEHQDGLDDDMDEDHDVEPDDHDDDESDDHDE